MSIIKLKKIKGLVKNPIFIIICLILLLIIMYNFSNTGIKKGTFSATFDNMKSINVSSGANPQAVAIVFWNDTISETGWGSLNVATNNKYSAEQQAYAAGFLEAYVTWERAYQYWHNYKVSEYGSEGFSPKLQDFMLQQKNHVEKMSKKNIVDPFWSGINLVLKQFNGFADGYHASAKSDKALSTIELYMLNSVGDLEDLNELYPNKKILSTTFASLEKSFSKLLHEEKLWHSCSALIQIIENGNDVAAGHTTWRSYYAMLRIYKIYNFGYAKKTMSIASSPGLLHSKDDFYALSNGLVIMETTNTINNKHLWDKITPKCALSWQRVMCANILAHTPKQWVDTFKVQNSGTYNNQWMALDTYALKKILPIKTSNIQNVLWIAEQVPGFIQSGDVTHILLSQGYWPSYNVPYFKNIFNISGYPELIKHPAPHHVGIEYSYEKCSRALIFKRYQQFPKTLENFKNMMQYNDYLHDPISKKNPKMSISSRYDLQKSKDDKRAFGGVDSKITSVNNITNNNIIVQAICGPTRSHDLPTFDWSGFEDTVHIGLPPRFNFDWIKINSNDFAMN
jgi:hypothetical protein